MKYLIVGLGNVGDKYKGTRHNIGFDVVDAIAKEKSLTWEQKKHAFVTDFKLKSHQVYLLKPTTFMNLSGKAVRYYLQEFNISIENLLIVVDDLALPIAKLRIKPKGSDAGHNGLKSLQELLGTQDYARLKFGIGNDYPKGKQADFVLSGFDKNERIDIDLSIEQAKEVIYLFASIGIEKAMNVCN
jgi:peptidyl-tRNA hydrolase, PTH1 family